ncbi:hypothetical protein JQ557_24095 [Bradyrhizobium sp. U87765 SZCCT0131]|uniref:hypothetical protein n=2 Tax=Bradyrhizobium TaxID=374 RepID=UPI001BAA3905|nr:hypothetical protein [Bradyrhizobium sp. U87765 SZCCT0109]MBR1221101.1 hypothetical protein [Bradyrhizobium sp. U87765 SZCCT0131]MBR1260079.1 hypothetical protein [Bradyrhizobium sp. U87765 SZCCT0134]MBR1307672.1 hypothetical protein [Bradyrhizobium sp. U87765 SZCCT0110]MBR1349939.1 hypothetical protein [Bradyrhizobium sp. U87765 SZCCT0048]MBR1321626.1 hypothetical protein [Bradyrhizobium sp. U87765 SZCCT0109]
MVEQMPDQDASCTLADLLRARGVDAAAVTAIRNDLHPEHVCDDFRSIADLDTAGVLHIYDRMQDGPRIAHDRCVLSFMALPDGKARLTAHRRFAMRRPGIAPSDIVYDHDAAHLLHNFIAHASAPVFYDVREESGLEDLVGRLIVQWPAPLAQDIRDADDVRIRIVDESSGT